MTKYIRRYLLCIHKKSLLVITGPIRNTIEIMAFLRNREWSPQTRIMKHKQRGKKRD